MFASVMPLPKQHYSGVAGIPLVGGKIYTYGAGTTTPKATYTDADATTPQANPIVLNARGEPANVIFWSGSYYVEIRDALGNLIYSVDDYQTPVNANELQDAAGAGTIGFSTAVTYPGGSIGNWLVNLVTSVGASFIGYIQTGTGAVLRTLLDKMLELPSAGDYGSVPGSSIDNTPKIQAGITARNHLKIYKPGNYRLDGMLELGDDQSLELGPGVFLWRYSANSASVEPLIWMKGSNAMCRGAGQTTSGLITQNACPKGVLRLGHKDMTESHANVLYCTLADMLLRGPISYGQLAGSPDFGLFMADPLIGGLASFFHNVRNLCISDVNSGLVLFGEANANTICNIQGVRIGNTTHPVPNRNAMFVNAGATDNVITGSFFHQSPNSTCLVVDNYDNTATPGGSNHIQQANTWHGITAEQGGVTAKGLVAVVATGACHYDIMSNCAGGDVVPAGFYDNNWRIGYGVSKNSFLTEAATQKVFTGLNTAGLTVMQRKFLRLSGLTENVTYNVMQFAMPSNSTSALVKILFNVTSGAGLDWQGAGEVTYQIVRSSAGVVTATALFSRYTGLCRPCVPEISGTNAILKFNVANNGTGTSVTALLAECAVISTVTPTYYETPTVGIAGTVLPANTASRGTTAQRPTLVASDAGTMYLDNTLNANGKPIWWNGTAWVDATAAVV